MKMIPKYGSKKFITCILYKGGGPKILEKLYQQGIYSCVVNSARGSGIGDLNNANGKMDEFSKEVVNIVVDSENADAVFDLIYETAEIDRPYGGVLFMGELKLATPYILPEGIESEIMATDENTELQKEDAKKDAQ